MLDCGGIVDRWSVAEIRLVNIFGHLGQGYFLLGQSNEVRVNFDFERRGRFAKAALEVQTAEVLFSFVGTRCTLYSVVYIPDV
jgi:hypothetical protein